MDIEILGNKVNPSVIVIGVFHGDEPQGDYLIREYFKNNPNTGLMMLPCLNKFGFKAGKRTNANGVDLNRNFPTANWAKTDKGDFYSGEIPASEEETKFLVDLIEKYNPLAILTFHAPYKVVNYDDASNKNSRKLAEQISDIIGYPVVDDIGYATPGSFGTWAGKEKNIPTITLELDENIDINLLLKPTFKIFQMLENY